jgi:hypothetical protein
MDRITETQVGIFCKEYGLAGLAPFAQSEHFAAFATVKRHYNRTFDPTDMVVGSGGDTGIDAIAIIVNNISIPQFTPSVANMRSMVPPSS